MWNWKKPMALLRFHLFFPARLLEVSSLSCWSIFSLPLSSISQVNKGRLVRESPRPGFQRFKKILLPRSHSRESDLMGLGVGAWAGRTASTGIFYKLPRLFVSMARVENHPGQTLNPHSLLVYIFFYT